MKTNREPRWTALQQRAALVCTPLASCRSAVLARTPLASCLSAALVRTPLASSCLSAALVRTPLASCLSAALVCTPLASSCLSAALVRTPPASCLSAALVCTPLASTRSTWIQRIQSRQLLPTWTALKGHAAGIASGQHHIQLAHGRPLHTPQAKTAAVVRKTTQQHVSLQGA